MNALNIVKKIEELFPDISGVEVQSENKIFLGNVAEGGMIDNMPACEYNSCACDPDERIWIMDVHIKLNEFIDNAGWFVECHDPGTYYAYHI